MSQINAWYSEYLRKPSEADLAMDREVFDAFAQTMKNRKSMDSLKSRHIDDSVFVSSNACMCTEQFPDGPTSCSLFRY